MGPGSRSGVSRWQAYKVMWREAWGFDIHFSDMRRMGMMIVECSVKMKESDGMEVVAETPSPFSLAL